MRSLPRRLLLIVAAAGACGSSDVAPDAGGAVERTLSSCTTDIAADAPLFFRRYFRCVRITLDGATVVIASEGLPPHRSYYYGEGHPNYTPFDTSRGALYHPNPNRIATRSIVVRVPLAPVTRGIVVAASMVDGVVGTSAQEYPLGTAGVALDGVPLFNPLAAPGDDIEAEKYTFDSYEAHPAPGGVYHYHAPSPGPLEAMAAAGAAGVELYGIMCDGTVVLGCTELGGAAVAGALDAQGGHSHDLVDAAGQTLLSARYHVHVCPAAAGGRRYTPEIQVHTACSASQ